MALASFLIALGVGSASATPFLAASEDRQPPSGRRPDAPVSRATMQAVPGRQSYFARLDMYQEGDADWAVAACVQMHKRDAPDSLLLRRLSNERLRAAVLLHIETILKGAPADLLKADEYLVEARGRLGRVLQIEQRSADARREFEQSGAEASAPFLACLAALLKGQVEEHEKQYDAAIQAYQSRAERRQHACRRWARCEHNRSA